MKRLSALVSALALCSFPALAFAQSSTPQNSTPIAQTVAQLTAVAAALEAQQQAISSGQSLACAAVFSASSVQLGQEVWLGWGSVGALDPFESSSSVSMWPQNGVSTLSFTQAGTWTYSFTFYSAAGATTTCSSKIAVTK